MTKELVGEAYRADEVRLAESGEFSVGRPVEILSSNRREIFEPPRLVGRDKFPRADTALPTRNHYGNLWVDAVPDAVLLPGRVILESSCSAVLRETFLKHPTHRHQGVRRLENGNYRPKQPVNPDEVEYLRGAVYYLDCEFADIYGHNLLEVLPAAWAVGLMDRDDLRFATSVRLRPYLRQALGQVGVPEERIVSITRPTRCEMLFIPSPAVVARRFVHPVCTDVFARIAELRFSRGGRRHSRRPGRMIYLSRRRVGERSLDNEPDVERLARKFGFTVIHPQEFSLPEQIRALRQATHVMGPGGSAMHNAVFTQRGTRVMIVSSSSWFTVIDILLSQRRYDLTYVFGDPLDRSLVGQRSKAPWSVDLSMLKEGLASFAAR